MKKILKISAVYLGCVATIAAGVYFCITFYAQKTFYLDEKQWHPAEPETQHIDPARLNKALDYVDTRLPTARSLLVLRNGKTVVEKYYWHGGPKATDYLHSLNLPLLQVLIGIAIDHQLIQEPEQPLSAFFQKHLTQTLIPHRFYCSKVHHHAEPDSASILIFKCASRFQKAFGYHPTVAVSQHICERNGAIPQLFYCFLRTAQQFTGCQAGLFG